MQDVAMEFPAINGFGHIDLTVTDVERSAQWWEEVMGFNLVHQEERLGFKVWNVFHKGFGTAIGLVVHDHPATDCFDERAIGLDHLALRVPDLAALEAWAKHLDDIGIKHSGIQEEIGGRLIVFRDPDNIQLELFASDPELLGPELRAMLASPVNQRSVW
jgi:catechol 2,3-dioxygenase-like lactoylglutathione lyase family enzyme